MELLSASLDTAKPQAVQRKRLGILLVSEHIMSYHMHVAFGVNAYKGLASWKIRA